VTANADGTEVSRWPAPRPLAGQLKRVRGCSRSLSRKQRGSPARKDPQQAGHRGPPSRQSSRQPTPIPGCRRCRLGLSIAAPAASVAIGTETPRRTSQRGPSVRRLPGPPSGRPGHQGPLEGKALAIASAMVKPAPVKGEPTLGLIA
jgi:hypothetical protein